MPSSEANFSGNKVELNLDSSRNNPIVKLMCLGGLPTFVPSALDLLEVHIVLEIDEPLLKE